MPGLYLHIPFCKSRCGYCDFFSCTSHAAMEPYLGRLAEELTQRAGFFAPGELKTVYIGGGTPSLLDLRQLEWLVPKIYRLWGMDQIEEFTLEANPDDLDYGYMLCLRELGINRLSLGVQSFDDGELRLMQRRHDSVATLRAFEQAREAGFDNISIDLIYGMKDDGAWARSLETAVQLRPEHISAYLLSVEPNTPFHRSGVEVLGDAACERQYAQLCEILGQAGYEHYEMSNFALPGRRSRHNSAYWSGERYLGAGASAHSYDGRARWWNPSDLGRYLIGEIAEHEVLTDSDRYNEFIMTRLRTAAGVSLEELGKNFGARKLQRFLSRAEEFAAQGKLAVEGGRVRILEHEMLRSDTFIADFFELDK